MRAAEALSELASSRGLTLCGRPPGEDYLVIFTSGNGIPVVARGGDVDLLKAIVVHACVLRFSLTGAVCNIAVEPVAEARVSGARSVCLPLVRSGS